MKQILIAFAVFSVATVFSGCDESKQKSAAEVGKESSVVVESSRSTDIVFGEKFPEVLKVEATSINDTKWQFNVTLSSKYDSPQRYADAWRVLDSENQELGIRVLGHDHAAEQPFTRSGMIEVSSDIKVVFVEGRDQDNGWSGQRFEYQMPTQR